jgi:hypothetical protein
MHRLGAGGPNELEATSVRAAHRLPSPRHFVGTWPFSSGELQWEPAVHGWCASGRRR